MLPLLLAAEGAVYSPSSTTRGNEATSQSEPHRLNSAPPDTLPARYPVRPTTVQREDGTRPHPADLKDPENLKTEVFYDEASGTYRLGTKLGENYLEAPFYMSAEEYRAWSDRRTIAAYFRKKNADDFAQKDKEKFDFTDMHFDLGLASRIFGPGGIRIKTQGSAELKIGANTRFVDNPSLSERARKVFGFDFDEKINLSANGKVGDKVNLDFNYNSEATFNFDTQNFKLRYEGKEDEIVKLVEAGNVSMPTNSSLIRGAARCSVFAPIFNSASSSYKPLSRRRNRAVKASVRKAACS